MPVHRVAKNMKKARPARRATKPAREVTSVGNGNGAGDAKLRSANGSALTKTINRLFEQEKWSHARQLLLSELDRDPDSHWLRTRLGTTYYEERDYDRALREVKKAYRLAPNCPLVLWDYAGNLDALGRKKQAIGVYNRLLSKGVEAVGYEECGEGIPWAMAVLTDCYYRLGICHADLGDMETAAKYFTTYLMVRRSSPVDSIYSVAEALARLRALPSC